MGLPPLRHEPPPDGLGPPRGDGATRAGRREPLGKEIGRAIRIETVISSSVIWAAAPACPARNNSGPTDVEGPDVTELGSASKTCTAITSRTAAHSHRHNTHDCALGGRPRRALGGVPQRGDLTGRCRYGGSSLMRPAGEAWHRIAMPGLPASRRSTLVTDPTPGARRTGVI